MKNCSSPRITPRVASRPPLAKKKIHAAKKETPKTSSASYSMLARRRARLGVTLRLVSAGVGGGRRHEALPLVGRQRLVFRPFFLQVLLVRVLARHVGEALVVLARLAPLLRRELGPRLHAASDPFLLLRLHLRIALGDRDPLLPALRLERVPVRLEGREHLLLLGVQLRPCGLHIGAWRDLRGGLVGGLFGRVRAGLRRRPGGDRERQQDREGAQHHSSAARFFSKFWKPRSRYASIGRSSVRSCESISTTSARRWLSCQR